MLVAKKINTEEFRNPTKLFDPYTKISNKIMDNRKLSIHAKQLIYHLTRRPKTWIPRPTDMKNHLKCGERIWRRVCKELKEAGFLRLKSGGNGRGGSQLEFDPKGRFRDDHQKGSETITMIAHINNNSTSKQYNNKTTTTLTSNTENTMIILDADVVVTLVNRMKDEAGVTEKDAHQYLGRYQADKIIEKLAMLKKKTPDTPAAWFRVALLRDFKDPKPSPMKIVSTHNNSERDKKLEASALQQMSARTSEYEARMTPAQIEEKNRIQEELMKRLGSRKRESHSA